MKRFCVLLGALVATFCALPAQATLWTFDPIILDGLQETPPNASPGTGTGTASLDDVSGLMMVSGSYSGMTAPANNAHIHCCAPPGTPAGVLFGITFDAATSGNFSGSATLTSTQIANVLNGLSYVNIHTSNFPGGELRGQIVNPVPEPATLAMIAIGALGALSLRRRAR